MEKQRVEALSDAILAIIVTIMALELQLPEELTVVGLRSMLPMLFIYITSFLQIMAVWLSYHELYKLVDHVSFRLFGANSFWLLTASFVPLATRGIGQHSANFAFLLFYLIVLALWDVAWIIMTAMVIKTSQRPLSAEEKKDTLSVGTIIWIAASDHIISWLSFSKSHSYCPATDDC